MGTYCETNRSKTQENYYNNILNQNPNNQQNQPNPEIPDEQINQPIQEIPEDQTNQPIQEIPENQPKQQPIIENIKNEPIQQAIQTNQPNQQIQATQINKANQVKQLNPGNHHVNQTHYLKQLYQYQNIHHAPNKISKTEANREIKVHQVGKQPTKYDAQPKVNYGLKNYNPYQKTNHHHHQHHNQPEIQKQPQNAEKEKSTNLIDFVKGGQTQTVYLEKDYEKYCHSSNSLGKYFTPSKMTTTVYAPNDGKPKSNIHIEENEDKEAEMPKELIEKIKLEEEERKLEEAKKYLLAKETEINNKKKLLKYKYNQNGDKNIHHGAVSPGNIDAKKVEKLKRLNTVNPAMAKTVKNRGPQMTMVPQYDLNKAKSLHPMVNNYNYNMPKVKNFIKPNVINNNMPAAVQDQGDVLRYTNLPNVPGRSQAVNPVNNQTISYQSNFNYENYNTYQNNNIYV